MPDKYEKSIFQITIVIFISSDKCMPKVKTPAKDEMTKECLVSGLIMSSLCVCKEIDPIM